MTTNQMNKASEQLTLAIVYEEAKMMQKQQGTLAASQYLKQHGCGLSTALRVLNPQRRYK